MGCAQLAISEILPLEPSCDRKTLCCFEVIQLLIYYTEPYLKGPGAYERCAMPSLKQLSETFACSPLELLRCFEQFRQAGYNYQLTSPEDPIWVWAD